MKPLRQIAVLPTLFTLGNLICGFFAIVVAARVAHPDTKTVPTAADIRFRNPAKVVGQLNPEDPTHNCMLSGLLIFVAMIFDTVDGYVARLTRKTSDFGAQLDSLCDVVTFGVAPGFLLVKMCPSFTHQHRDAVWAIAALFAACAALRLARFNVELSSDDDHLFFRGLPSPAAAGTLASFAILFYTVRRESTDLLYAEQIDYMVQTVLPFFALFVALLMVSSLRYPHLINQLLHGSASLGYLVGLMSAVLAVAVMRGFSLPIVCSLYVFSAPVLFLWQWVQHRNDLHEQPST